MPVLDTGIYCGGNSLYKVGCRIKSGNDVR